jgi:hypothetical protein
MAPLRFALCMAGVLLVWMAAALPPRLERQQPSWLNATESAWAAALAPDPGAPRAASAVPSNWQRAAQLRSAAAQSAPAAHRAPRPIATFTPPILPEVAGDEAEQPAGIAGYRLGPPPGELVQRFEAERDDDAWTDAMTLALRDQLEARELDTRSLYGVECRSTLCRVRVKVAGPHELLLIAPRPGTLPSADPGALSVSAEPLHDGILASVFFARSDRATTP